MDRPLTNKQELFIENYCNNGYNASKAYRDAYPNCKAQHGVMGHENLQKPKIKAAIDAYKAKISKKYEHNREKALAYLEEAIEMARDQDNISGMVSAVKEMNAISNLHSQTVRQVSDEVVIPEAEKELISEAARALTVKLAQ
jgi:phage terminase small subunit